MAASSLGPDQSLSVGDIVFTPGRSRAIVIDEVHSGRFERRILRVYIQGVAGERLHHEDFLRPVRYIEGRSF